MKRFTKQWVRYWVRRVFLATIWVSGLTVLQIIGMMYPVWLVVLLGIAPITALLGTIYLWRLYYSDIMQPRSWLIRMLATTSTILTASVFYIGFLALYRILGIGDQIPSSLITFLTIDLLIISQIPVYKAWRMYKASHGGSRPTVPRAMLPRKK